jgi:hypothetical protein
MNIDPIHSTDEELLHVAVNNTYRFLLTGRKLEGLKPGSWLLSNATDISTIDILIDYYVSIEYYERCAKLVELKNKLLEKNKEKAV